jgi:hypothetical protein
MRVRLLAALAGIAITLVTAAPAAAHETPPPPPTPGNGPDLHSHNVKLLDTNWNTANPNTDLAFWGNRAYAGNFGGFRVLDLSDPAHPAELADVHCYGYHGDMETWGNLLFQTVDRPLTSSGCDGKSTNYNETPNAWEGLRIWDVSDPTKPQLVNTVRTDCGVHNESVLPDPEHGQVFLYVASYPLSYFNAHCQQPFAKFSVVKVPLNNPAAAYVAAQPAVNADPFEGAVGCHDFTFYLPKHLAAASCLSEGQMWDVADPLHPKVLRRIHNAGVSVWHGAAFTWDGKYVIFGDEYFGSPGCDNPPYGSMWAYKADDPAAPVGRWSLPKRRPGDYTCTPHFFATMPSTSGYYVVSSYYQGGMGIVDFTDPAHPHEVAYYDAQQPIAANEWSAYWYNGFIYANDISRGVDTFLLSDNIRAGTVRLPHLNPQTYDRYIPLRHS